MPDTPQHDKEPLAAKAPPAGKLFPCANCGAKVEFDPRTRSLKCPYCGHTTSLPAADASDEVVERDFREYLDKLEAGGGSTIAGRSSQVRCTGCGAMVLLEDKVVTEKCPFCGTHLENKPESAAGMIPPESLVPFKVDLRAARESFEKWIAGLWFAPTELKQLANLGQLNGVYVPYWTYDSMTYTRYQGERGDNYQEEETYTERDAQGNQVTKTRTVTKIRWYPAAGEVQHFFDDVLICGTKSIPPHLVSYLHPWDLKHLEPFRSEFLGGFKTERYGVGLREGFDEAKQIMAPTIDQLIRRDIGGDHQRITWKKTRYLAVTFKHLLLPVWVANYRYRETLYQILINGRTGRISGERPWSAWKIIRLIVLILLVIALVMTIASLAGKGGGRAGQASPDSLRVTHSAVSSSTTSASVHHDRRSGTAVSDSRTAAFAANRSARPPTSEMSNTRPPVIDASPSSRGRFAVNSVNSSDSGDSTSNVARSFPDGPRRWSAHSGISCSTA
jgi:DNA-directed RNA polymerase subunit RPC12/RpoP